MKSLKIGFSIVLIGCFKKNRLYKRTGDFFCDYFVLFFPSSFNTLVAGRCPSCAPLCGDSAKNVTTKQTHTKQRETNNWLFFCD